MTKHNTIQVDYTISENNYQLKSLLNIDSLIPKDDSVRLLSQIIEEMNLEKLYQTYSRIRGNSVTPRQLKPAYNVQFGVDSEYIVWASVGPQTTDTTTLIPFLKSIEKHTGFKYSKVIADSGYKSEENYVFLEDNQQLSFLKTSDYEIKKTKN